MLIGITTVNGPERVMSCIRSFREVFPTTVEHAGLVVDDGSNKNEADVIDQVAGLFGFDVIHHQDDKGRPENRGIPSGWNAIVQRARDGGHEWACVLNDDVAILPGTLESAESLASLNPSVALIGLVPLHTNKTGLQLSWPDRCPRGVIYQPLYSYGCAFLVRTSAWKQVGGYDEQFKSHFEDVDFSLRVVDAGYVILNTPYPVLHDWSSTFKDNSSLHGHLRLEISRRLFRKKWGKDMHDFPPRPDVSIDTPHGVVTARYYA